MSQGILETILAGMTTNAQSLESLHTKIDALAAAMGKTHTVTLESTAAAVEGQATTTPPSPTVDASASEQSTTQTVLADVELDADGVPWDIRIHSGKNASEGKRTKGGKGIWQRRRKIDDALYESVTKELKAKYAATDTSANTAPPAPGNSEIAPPPPANDASAPPPPSTGDTPPPPANDTTEIAPPPPADDPTAAARKAATDAMNKLTKEHNVILDAIIMHFEETYGVDNFSLITADNYERLANELTDWAARVETAQGTVNAITRIYEKSPETIKPYIDQVINKFQYVSGGVAEVSQTVGQVPYSQASQLNQDMNALYLQCRKTAGMD